MGSLLLQQTECDNRLGVKKQFGLLRMEASTLVISKNLPTEGSTRDRFICFQIISSDQDLLFVEAGSVEPGSRCLPTKLVPQESLCFSPFFMIPKVLSNVLKDKVPVMILVTPAWPSELRYPEAMRMFLQQSILLTWRRDLLKNSKGEVQPIVQKKTLKLVAWMVAGLDYKSSNSNYKST